MTDKDQGRVIPLVDPGYDTPYAKFLEQDLETIELMLVKMLDAIEGKDKTAIKRAIQDCRLWIEDIEGADYESAREWIIEYANDK
jgi:hypothetical protein